VRIAELSFGRVGRAKDMIENKELEATTKEVSKFLKGGSYQRDLLKKLVEPDNKEKLKVFLGELTANLSKDPNKNYETIRAILKRLTVISQFNVNKRLQLEAGLIWNT